MTQTAASTMNSYGLYICPRCHKQAGAVCDCKKPDPSGSPVRDKSTAYADKLRHGFEYFEAGT